MFLQVQRVPHLGTMSRGDAEAVATLGFWQLAVAAWASFKADVDMVVPSVRGAWMRFPGGIPRRRLLLFPNRTWVEVALVALAGWAVPLLLLVVEPRVVEQGCSKADVGIAVWGAGAAGDGDAVLESGKLL